jgi:glycerol-3-phosphate O-acyltransferase/dihydroxyacetone phosphate acyltransferase
MALGAMEKYGCQVTMVPAGFNYYNPQNFRSKVILEFGPPFVITQELVDLYRKDKPKAISELLSQL